MPIVQWSADTVILHLGDDPLFSEELVAVRQYVYEPGQSVVLDFASITNLSSYHLTQLTRLSQRIIDSGGQLVLCSIAARDWGIFLVTGMDRSFAFSDNVSTALATLSIQRQARRA